MSVSLGGIVLSGLVSAELEGLSGALFHSAATALAFYGLLLCVRGVEARVGTADVKLLGGLVGRLPGMATGYLLLGLAVGFPGMATFASEDLLVRGLLREQTWAALVALILGSFVPTPRLAICEEVIRGPLRGAVRTPGHSPR